MSDSIIKTGNTKSKKKQRFSADDLNINTGLSRRNLRDDNDRAKTTDDLDSIDRDVDITDLRSDADATSNDVISDAQDGAPIGDSINLSVNSNLQRRKSLSDIDSPKSDVKSATKLKRKRSDSDPTADRQTKLDTDTQRSRTTDDLDQLRVKDQDSLDIDSDDDVPNPIGRRKSLSDLSDALNTVNTGVVDPRGRLQRSLSVGGDPTEVRKFIGKRIDKAGFKALNKSLENVDIDDLPLVKQFSLNDSSNDNDEEDFINDDDSETKLEISVRSSAYSDSSDTQQWRPLPDEADTALKDLRAELTGKQLGAGPDEDLRDLLDNIYHPDGKSVSLERLNDVYFMAQDKIDTTNNNPLKDAKDLSESEKQAIKKYVRLVNAVNKIDGKEAFINANNAKIYTAQKLLYSNFGSDDLNTFDLSIANAYGEDISDVSFNRKYDNKEINNSIEQYRQKMMQRLETELEGLGHIFKRNVKKFDGKFFQEKKHKNVVKYQEALLEKLRKVMAISKDVSSESTVETLNQFKLAITAMKTSADNYTSASEHKDRIQAVQQVLNRIDQLLVTDEKIINAQMKRSFGALSELHAALVKINPEAAKTFNEAMSALFFNASPEGISTTPIDALNAALDIVNGADEDGLDVKSALESKAFGGASEAATGLGQAAVLSGLVADAVAAFSFISSMRKPEGGVRTKEQLAQGAVVGTNLTKNITKGFSTGVDAAAALGTSIGKDVATVSATAAQVSGVAGIALGAGFAYHGALVFYKTNQRRKTAKNISDDEIRKAVQKRISTKRRRAFFEAVGGTIAVAGGTVAIVMSGGLAAPIIAGVGTLIALELSAERGINSVVKSNNKGKERQELAGAIFEHMNDLLANGQYNQAKQLAQALTNNKYKQSLMLLGTDGDATLAQQQAALIIMRDKLKTW
ncbi:hypothetical protein BJP34_18975 [Moorena producens PAL-8-15-08-1]|uniref:Uncharacterized protein n=1 Tax=Moorena producens PAL-8-15-08-1 TaxID=1458985 RepID=A0A1D8TUL4_9CYAN|nr:hypothetical protein [Moorena producens]AOX01245.1 hypothetical protein BJP34_18975 [Moorena producens PAL-8-15-08-1]